MPRSINRVPLASTSTPLLTLMPTAAYAGWAATATAATSAPRTAASRPILDLMGDLQAERARARRDGCRAGPGQRSAGRNRRIGVLDQHGELRREPTPGMRRAGHRVGAELRRV